MEEERKVLPRDKRFAMHRFLQSITRMDYQCLNKPIRWKDDLGEHTGFYHPMDLIHFLVKNLDIPSRGKLYQKLSICKLAVPVLFPNDGQVYMDMSLRQVKIAWVDNEGHIVEGDVTNAPILIISMIRLGKQSTQFFSKSKLANDLFEFRPNPYFGSCGFFTKDSLSSNDSRKTAKGTVEGLWFEAKSDVVEFPASFGLLNLRGDGLEHVQTATTLASCSDIVFMFCDSDMFKDDKYKTFLLETAEQLKLKKDGEKRISKLVVIHTKDARNKVRENSALFKEISEKIVRKKVDSNSKTFLVSLNEIIQNSLRETSLDSKTTLNARLKHESKESDEINIESLKYINNLFLKMMDKIKNEDEDQRSNLRESLFPLHSTTKKYAQLQRNERRSLGREKQKFADELINVRHDRYEKIKGGLPREMSAFLKEFFNMETIDQKLMFVHNIQYSLDDWCSKNLFSIRLRYVDSLKKLASLKDKEIEKRKMDNEAATRDIDHETIKNEIKAHIKAETKQCTSWSKLLLDMSVGIENLFREIGEICETIKIKEPLIKELGECNKKLPELAAALLMKGFAIELMEGDGLSVPRDWIESVMKALEKLFKEIMKKDPKIFVLTVLGIQSTGKSTLLNTMFGVQFQVSSGRCTKGAFMQLIPISLDDFPFNGLLLVDTEGLGAPEYKQDNTHDNEIATFVLGISDLAIINVRGELPTNIENFLEISICALMRMSMVDFHPSVVFVHQNCDPSSKDKNLTARHSFVKEMDKVVSTQARLIQKQDKFSCFQDVVDISLDDEKNDFVYFPQLLEGSSRLSPPSSDYSDSCSNLTRYILSKMKTNFKKYNNAQTLQEFSEKVKVVWKGVLEENFVLSLINSAEIQVKFDIDKQVSRWKLKMESYMEDILAGFCGEIEADFKGKELTPDLLSKKIKELKLKSYVKNREQMKELTDHIEKQTLNQSIYKNWEQKCKDKMSKIREHIVENCETRLKHYYDHEKNGADWRDELNQSKSKLQDDARETANELLRQKEKKAGGDITPKFSDHEIEKEFQKCWSSVKGRFISRKKGRTFYPEDVRKIFENEIGLKYGYVANYKEIEDQFGTNLQNNFKKEWIKPSLVEFKGNFIKKKIRCWREKDTVNNLCYLIRFTESKLSSNVIHLYEIGGLKKMYFQPDSAIFNCEGLIKQYLAIAIDLLEERHVKSKQHEIYNLTDLFKAMFSFKAAQLAITNFEEAQQSFIECKDISVKLDNERENIKQIFTLILKREGSLTIAAKQVAKRLHNAIKKAALKQVSTSCKEILLRLVPLKMHVHGLVLHDVIAMLDKTISEENVHYIQMYFEDPFKVLEEKIFHVFDGCTNIRLKDMIREKFDTALAKTTRFIKMELTASRQSSLFQVICQNKHIRSLGVGELDFDGIDMPKYYNAEGFQTKTESLKGEVKKGMTDEKDFIEKLKNFISETDEVDFDITLNDQLQIKRNVIRDVKNHLFECVKTCPFCQSPCNETHSKVVEKDIQHQSRCHRPQGFGGYIKDDGTDKFVISFCNDLVKGESSFKNSVTNFEYVKYKDYKNVNPYYNSWNIESTSSDEDYLYWKYITYQVSKNLNKFFPQVKKPDLSNWEKVSQQEAVKRINSLFHLDEKTIAKNKDGFHYIKTSK